MENLRSTIISGGRWMLLRQALGQPIRVIVSILLTRIIAPTEFGLVAKVLAITGVVELIFVNGLFGSIVQSKHVDNKQLNSLFVFSIVITLFISISLYMLAAPITLFYEDIRVKWVVKVASVAIFFSGIRLVFNAILNKKLLFKKMALINIAATLISSIVALVLAYQGYGYKALIYQVLVLNIVMSVATMIAAKWLPRIELSITGLRKHLTFGVNVLLNNLLNYAVRNTDNVAIGKFQSDLELGYYSRAYYLMLLPISQVGQIFSSTLFPAFSEIQGDKKRILSILNQVQEIIIILVYPSVILAFINIDFLVVEVLGENWTSSSVYFKLFTPLMLAQIFTAQIGNVYMALNKMGIMLKISLFTKPIIISVIIWMAMESALYVAVSITILSIIFGWITYIQGLFFLGKDAISKQFNFLKSTITYTAVYLLLQLLIYYFVSDRIILLLVSFITLILFYISVLKYNPDLKNKFIELFKLGKYKLS